MAIATRIEARFAVYEAMRMMLSTPFFPTLPAQSKVEMVNTIAMPASGISVWRATAIFVVTHITQYLWR